MEIHTKQISLTNIGGTVVLIATVSAPVGISERADRFYSDISTAFERAVKGRMLAEAVAAYDESPDRRKRYRFTPLKAALCCKQLPNGVEIFVLWRDVRIFRERHLWKDEFLFKREKLV